MVMTDFDKKRARHQWLRRQPHRLVDTGELDRAANTDIKVSLLRQELEEVKLEQRRYYSKLSEQIANIKNNG